MRKLYPDITYGAIASSGECPCNLAPHLVLKSARISAITHATVDYSDYWEAIMRNADPICVEHIASAIKTIDKIIDTPLMFTPLKALFGLKYLKHEDDFASVITKPLFALQQTNWDPAVDRPGVWKSFCRKFGRKPPKGRFEWIKVTREVMNYASWFREHVADGCWDAEEVSSALLRLEESL